MALHSTIRTKLPASLPNARKVTGAPVVVSIVDAHGTETVTSADAGRPAGRYELAPKRHDRSGNEKRRPMSRAMLFSQRGALRPESHLQGAVTLAAVTPHGATAY